VDALREGGYVRLSLVAQEDGQVIGHILFSRLPIITATGVVEALALAPWRCCQTVNGEALARGSLKRVWRLAERRDTGSWS
jgi:putative acetyltransferase